MDENKPTIDREQLLQLRPKPARGAMMREEEHGAILAGGEMPVININADGLAVWRLCDGTRTVEQIRELLLEEYEEEELDDRLFELVRFCLENGYLVDTPSEGSAPRG